MKKQLVLWALVCALVLPLFGCVRSTVASGSAAPTSTSEDDSEKQPAADGTYVPGKPDGTDTSGKSDGTDTSGKSDGTDQSAEPEETYKPVNSAEISGLVAIYDQYKITETITSSSKHIKVIDVVCIDPSTGASRTVRSFSDIDASKIRPLYETAAYVIDRHWFSPDYTLIGATYTGSGDKFAGWIDQNGVFTNITEKCFGPRGDFSAAYKHQAIGFDDFGNFYFYSEAPAIGASNTYYRVPVDNPSPDTVENIDAVLAASPYSPSTDFAIKCLLEFGAADACLGYQDRNYRTTDWIDSDRCLVNTASMIRMEGDAIVQIPPTVAIMNGLKSLSDYRAYSIAPLDDISGSLIPVIQSRWNWNGVVSPDGKTVAFLSKLESESDVKLFSIPLEGGEPTMIRTDVDFLASSKPENRDSYKATLVEWR